MSTMITDLIDQLKGLSPPGSKVVVMPHFCIDNLISYKGGYESFAESLEKIAQQGGGNISLPQDLQLGGKAANCAKALSSLGITPSLIARTNEMGFIMLKHLLREYNMDLSHVKKDGDLAFTSSIELKGANIMISDAGSLSEFGPGNLTESDEDLIKDADYVFISDWGLNRKGTELAQMVFRWVKEGDGRTYFDPGDPSPKKETMDSEIIRLIKDLIGRGLVDVLSLNPAEAEKFKGIDYLRTLTRVDLHTKDYAMCFSGFKNTKKIPSFNVKPKRLTGAGDAWNAGNLFGEIMDLTHELRLLLANSVAAFYISDPQGKHPTISELIEFFEKKSD
jgi:ribokinase